MLSRAKSGQLFAGALKYIPGSVNSPVRAKVLAAPAPVIRWLKGSLRETFFSKP